MNVQELREALADLPGHWPVHVAVRADGSGGGADTDYLYTLDVVRDNFPTQGNMAVIRLDLDSVPAHEAAWLREQRRFPQTPAVGATAVRVCTVIDAECTRQCYSGPCKLERSLAEHAANPKPRPRGVNPSDGGKQP